MASNASYPDVHSMAFSRSIVLCCLSSTNIMLFFVQSRLNLMLILVVKSYLHGDNTLRLFHLIDLIYYGLLLFLRVGVISARLGLANGLDDPVTC